MNTTPRITRRRTPSRVASLLAAALAVSAMPVVTDALTAPAEAALPTELPIYRVVQEGLTQADAKALAERTGTSPMLRPDGAFTFVGENFAAVPQKVVADGKDEDGNPTVSQAIDYEALDAITALIPRKAKKRAAVHLDIPKGHGRWMTVGNTTFEQSDAKGNPELEIDLETTVSLTLTLAGQPLVGPGAKLRVSYAPDGSVTQLTNATRQLEELDVVKISSMNEARQACTSLYGREVKQLKPKLAYYAPPLTAQEADGRGSVELILPQWICQPATTVRDSASKLVGRMVPAVPELSPKVQLEVDTDGKLVEAIAQIGGGTAPYTLRWSSSSGTPIAADDNHVRYAPDHREGAVETLNLLVTDANGMTTVASATPSQKPGGAGHVLVDGLLGGQGGSFAEVGIEQTIDEWQCAQDSADGFNSEMSSHNQTVDFDWRGTNAWEQDFRDPSNGGDDSDWVDEVDIQWYTGHGWSGGFTFKGTNADGSIVPADARWGNRDLEWLNLESCQVLRDTTGTLDHLGRWGPTMDGLHLINGFDTNAYCINGGTGERFAEYLFDQTFFGITIRPALTVQQAWAAMANDLEPAGVRWRTMGPVDSSGVTNLNDHYWGQGSVGPDIRATNTSGWFSISGLT